jgi:hypothetical protein
MTTKPDGMRYCGAGVPRKVPEGRVLAHSHVRHTVDQENGERGFRCWTWPKDKVPSNFKLCKCGWSGLPHYRIRGETKRQDALMDRCLTVDEAAQRTGPTRRPDPRNLRINELM